MAREVLSNGVIVPEKYTRDWFDDFRTNLVKLNDAITAIAGKQNALTQEQLDAVNSAITSQKVTAYDDHIADTSKHLTDSTAPKALADEDGNNIKSSYGKLAGSQTWTGSNTFTNNLMTCDPSSVSAGSYGKGINFYDSTSTRYGYIQPHVTTDNSRNLTLGADTGYVELGSHLVPYTNSGVDLGRSSLRWSSVYANAYYGYTMYFEAMSERVIRFQTNGSNNYRNYDTYIGTTYAQYDSTVAMHRSVGRRGDTTEGATINDVDTSFSFFKAHIGYKAFDLVDAVKATNDGTENSLKPITTSVTDFGTSANRWKSVYADSYYYGTTAWGLDQANTWTGANTFKSQNTNLALQSTTSELGSLTTASNWFRWIDKNGAQNAYISRDVWSDGADSLRIVIVGKRASGAPSTSGTEIDCGIILNLEADGTKSVTPFDNNINLGTSTNKWKTINGVNPGALSLPDASSLVELDTTDWNLDGTATDIVANGDGWIQVVVRGDSTSYVALQVGYYSYPNCYYRTTGNAIGDSASAMIPVKSGQSVRMYLKGTSIYIGRFFPMLGNV